MVSSNQTQRVDRSGSGSGFGLLFAGKTRSRTFDLPVDQNYTAEIPVVLSVIFSGRRDELDGVSTHLVIIQENNIVWHRIIEGFELEVCCVLSDVLVWRRCGGDAAQGLTNVSLYTILPIIENDFGHSVRAEYLWRGRSCCFRLRVKGKDTGVHSYSINPDCEDR